MFKNAYLDAKIGFDPAENEPPKECCVVAALPVSGASVFFSQDTQHLVVAPIEKMVR